ncbi:MAG: DNA translocase FtsK 4TM domain-containing protein [Magnetococcales bacterium]|nr:DNA translocase FtsK 4TM domain-containing protein [Magnetococcales bacterium]
MSRTNYYVKKRRKPTSNVKRRTRSKLKVPPTPKIKLPTHIPLVREVLGLMMLCASAFSVLSLSTYNRADPSFSFTGLHEVTNLGGLIGAFVADLMIQLAGYSAVWIPLVFAVIGFRLFKRKQMNISWDRFFSILVLMNVTSLITALAMTQPTTLPSGPGGLLGYQGALLIERSFGLWGGLILLVPLGLIAAMVLTRFSLVGFLAALQSLRDDFSIENLSKQFTTGPLSALATPFKLLSIPFGFIAMGFFWIADTLQISSSQEEPEPATAGNSHLTHRDMMTPDDATLPSNTSQTAPTSSQETYDTFAEPDFSADIHLDNGEPDEPEDLDIPTWRTPKEHDLDAPPSSSSQLEHHEPRLTDSLRDAVSNLFSRFQSNHAEELEQAEAEWNISEDISADTSNDEALFDSESLAQSEADTHDDQEDREDEAHYGQVDSGDTPNLWDRLKQSVKPLATEKVFDLGHGDQEYDQDRQEPEMDWLDEPMAPSSDQTQNNGQPESTNTDALAPETNIKDKPATDSTSISQPDTLEEAIHVPGPIATEIQSETEHRPAPIRSEQTAPVEPLPAFNRLGRIAKTPENKPSASTIGLSVEEVKQPNRQDLTQPVTASDNTQLSQATTSAMPSDISLADQHLDQAERQAFSQEPVTHSTILEPAELEAFAQESAANKIMLKPSAPVNGTEKTTTRKQNYQLAEHQAFTQASNGNKKSLFAEFSHPASAQRPMDHPYSDPMVPSEQTDTNNRFSLENLLTSEEKKALRKRAAQSQEKITPIPSLSSTHSVPPAKSAQLEQATTTSESIDAPHAEDKPLEALTITAESAPETHTDIEPVSAIEVTTEPDLEQSADINPHKEMRVTSDPAQKDHADSESLEEMTFTAASVQEIESDSTCIEEATVTSEPVHNTHADDEHSEAMDLGAEQNKMAQHNTDHTDELAFEPESIALPEQSDIQEDTTDDVVELDFEPLTSVAQANTPPASPIVNSAFPDASAFPRPDMFMDDVENAQPEDHTQEAEFDLELETEQVEEPSTSSRVETTPPAMESTPVVTPEQQTPPPLPNQNSSDEVANGMALENETQQPVSATQAPQQRQPIVESQPPLSAEEKESPLPALSMLYQPPENSNDGQDPEALFARARILEQKLGDFNIKGQVVNQLPGPVVTTFEFDPAPGLRANKVISLSDDLARSISAASVRVVGNIPGKNVIGIEVPNEVRETVYLRELLESDLFQKDNNPLTVALGSDITGGPVFANMAKMPHLLVAGTTGSGKSVAVNAMICSILFRSRPDEVRFLMVDPKMLELSIYEGIPHLLAPVVTDVRKAATLLKWAVSEMEERYRLMSEMAVRNLAGYNEKIDECIKNGTQPTRKIRIGFDPETGLPVEQEENIPLEKKPLIVIVIDELADLMIQVGKEVEPAIARLAQMARAAGLHLILATQRPSVDVITGLIKSNFPTRLAFQVSSKIDSRTILDTMGAERLLGMGDGLYLPPGTSHLQRIHAPFVADKEVHDLVEFLRSTGAPKYNDDVLNHKSDDSDDVGDAAAGAGNRTDEYDELYDQAVAVIVQARKVSTSMVQRHFKIGYNRAARIVEQMEKDGLISEATSAGKREVLAPGPMG